MRPFNVKLLCYFGLFVALAGMIVGCGADGDLLDENGQRYSAFVSFSDADDDETLTIDVLRDLDCDDDGNATDPEIFTDVLSEISISVDADAPGITLIDYTIEYIPLWSPDTMGTNVLPPDLIDVTGYGSFTLSIPSGGSATFATTLMSTDTKADYLTHWLSDANMANLQTSRYTIRITMYFEDEYLEDRTITIERTVYLGNYNNC